MNTKKTRILYILAVLAESVLLLGGCGGKDEQQDISTEIQSSAADETNPAEEAKSVEEIYAEITQAVSLQSPILVDEDFIMNYYGIDSTKLEEYVFSMSEDATQAECVIVMKARDIGDVDELADALQVVVDEKKNEMENYLPEQFAIVEKSNVETKGCYVWLVISEQSDVILDIIEENTVG